MHPSLSFEQAPPIDVPYRFLLTAPWFGVAAGLYLAAQGSEALSSRWAAETLALTHLLTLGFMLQAMCGALFQFVPVAAGGNVWRPGLVAGIVHPAFVVATLLLVFAFAGGRPELFLWAAALFGASIALYLGVVGWALLRTPAQGHTIVTLRYAVPGLGVTVALGVTLALGLGGVADLPLVETTNVHAAWGLGGWALLLLAAVSYSVVPMFQLTPPYPNWIARWLPPALMAALALWSYQLIGEAPFWAPAVLLAGGVLAAVYGGVTLQLQRRRRRKVTDATFLFFRGAMLCLFAIPVSVLVFTMVPGLADEPRGAVWLGVLALAGVFVSAIGGMLYKIVPFLGWLHLQRLGVSAGVLPPNMNQIIPELAMRRQMRVHFAALALLLAAVWVPVLARPAGLLFAASCAWLGWNLLGGARTYLRFKARIRADGACR